MALLEDFIDRGREGTTNWCHVILREGKYREVRRLWEAVGVEVSRLPRYDSFNLPKWLKSGRCIDFLMTLGLNGFIKN
jgi:23S rRNA pseudouridine2605 synthase